MDIIIGKGHREKHGTWRLISIAESMTIAGSLEIMIEERVGGQSCRYFCNGITMFHFVVSKHWASAMKVGAGRGAEEKNGSSPFLLLIVCVFLVFERRERDVFSEMPTIFGGAL